MLGTPELIAPRIESMLKQYKTDQIIDLCSGGGGAMPDIIKLMHERGSVAAKVTMTDLYPNITAAKHIKKLNNPSIDYLTESILPLMIAWDGTASNPRTYNADDFQELTALTFH
jgi:hypothetical protein